MYPIVTMTVSWVLVVARLVIAIQLTRLGLRQKLYNLLWLAAFFYITLTGDIFLTISPVTGFAWPFTIAVGLSEIALAMFVYKTFYRDRKSPYLIFLAIAVAILAADIYFSPHLPYYSPFNWLWLIWVGYQSYKLIAVDKSVEDWVKVRYKLVIAYSLVALVAPFYTVLTLIALVFPAFGDALYAPIPALVAQVGILAFVTVGVILEYLAWVMPEKYRRWLNRKYQSPVQDQTELSDDEIMRKFKAQA